MIRKTLILTILFALLFPVVSSARPLIADSYPRKINIDHNFKGIDILLYGARNQYGTIVVVARGPKKDFVLREKGKVAGIWTNTKNIELDDYYSFYSIASNKPIEEIQNMELLKDLKIGMTNLPITTIEEIDEPEKRDEYNVATVKLMEDADLFKLSHDGLFFWGETLFRTFIEFPKNIVRGEYSIDLYLFNDGLLHSFQTMPIIVQTVGFEAFIHRLAHEDSILYGLICVLIAISLGWATSAMFGRK